MATPDPKPLRILIVSRASCFFGAVLRERLRSRHFVILAVIFEDKDFKGNLPQPLSGINTLDYYFKITDVKVDSLLSPNNNPDVVVNLIALGKCTSGEVITSLNSLMFDIVHYCVREKKRLIQISPCEYTAVRIGSLPPSTPTWSPDDPKLRDDFIAKDTIDAMRCIETIICDSRLKFGLNYTIIRPMNWIDPKTNVFRSNHENWIPKDISFLVKSLMREEAIKLIDGEQTFTSFCHISEVADAFFTIIEYPEKSSGLILNMGNVRNLISLKALAERLLEIYIDCNGDDEPPPNLSVTDVSLDDLKLMGIGEGVYYKAGQCIPDPDLEAILGCRLGASLDSILTEIVTKQCEDCGSEDDHER